MHFKIPSPLLNDILFNVGRLFCTVIYYMLIKKNILYAYMVIKKTQLDTHRNLPNSVCNIVLESTTIIISTTFKKVKNNADDCTIMKQTDRL